MSRIAGLSFLALLVASTESFMASQWMESFTKTSSRRTTSLLSSSVTIALTREEGNNDKLEKQLKEKLQGSSVIMKELPCIAHAHGPDFDRLESTLHQQDWDYVVVTSPEAARVLATAWNFDDDRKEKIPAVAVVGKATQKALEQLGIPVDFCPTKATAKTLVAELPPIDKGKTTTTTTLLYPASAQAATTVQDGLHRRGFAVTRLNTYDTTIAKWTNDQKVDAQSIAVACFGSPSAVRGWLENTNDNRNVMAACIGETSAEACRECNFPEDRIFYPDKPGIPGWAQAVEDALQQQTQGQPAHPP